MPRGQVILLLLGAAALHVQAGKDQVAGLPGLQGVLPHPDREVAVLVLEVVAQHHHEPLAAQRLDESIEVRIRLRGGLLTRDVVQAERQRQDPVGLEARHLHEEALRDVGADRGDAVDAERDAPLQGPVGVPGLG